MTYKVLDLFSGIGGFSLGLERTGGFETVAFCEIEKFPQKVLAKHWPDVPIYEDVRNVTAEQLRTDGIIPNVITGGFPCQDISVAGNQKGITDETRSGLWSECARLLGEIRPDYAIFENVTALLSGDSGRWFQRVLWDISEVGYDAEWHCIPASSIGAPHQRDRIWIIAYPHHPNADSKRPHREEINQQGNVEPSNEQIGILGQMGSVLADTQGERIQGFRASRQQEPQAHESARLSLRVSERLGNATWNAEPSICRVVNGLPDRSHRIKGLGNAVVPQIPELIGRAILEAK